MANTYDPLKTYLTSKGQDFSMDNLKSLAATNGINGYTGTDQENTSLASLLSGAPAGGTYSRMTPEVAPIKSDYYPRTDAGTTPPITPTATPNNPAVVTPATPATIPTDVEKATTTLTKPKSMADYQTDAYKTIFPQYSGAIDAITQNYTKMIEEAQQRGVKNQGAARAQSAAFGWTGTPQADTASTEVAKGTDRAVASYTTAKNAEIGDLLAKVNTQAADIAKAQASQDINAAETVLKLRDKAMADAKEQVKTLAQGGVDFDTLQSKTPESINALKDHLGVDDNTLKAMFAIAKPQSSILESKVIGSTYYQVTKDPVTGKVSTQHFDLGFTPPADYNAPTIDKESGTIVWTPKTPDPKKDLASQIIIKRFAPGAPGAAGGSGTSGTYKTDLDALVGNATNMIGTKFGQQTFKNTIASARDDADKLNTIATVVLSKSSAPEREDFTNQTVAIKQIDRAIKLLDSGVQTGVFNAGQQYIYNQAGKDFDPKLAQLNQLIVSAIQPYRNSVTGAAWGTQEENEYQQLFGSTKYSPSELKQRLEGVKQIMKDKTAAALNAKANPLGTNNPFETPGTETKQVGGHTYKKVQGGWQLVQ